MADGRDNDGAQEFLQVFRRGVQFTEQLLAENEQLRTRVADLEQENKRFAEQALGEASFKELMDKMQRLEDEKQSLQAQCAETDSRSHAERYRELEDEVDRLANLYVAIYQLHSTLDLEEAVRMTFEILVNLVGAARFVLYAADGQGLVPVRSHGMALGDAPDVVLGQGPAGRAASGREVYLTDAPLDRVPAGQPVACVPLQAAERLLGLLVVDGFLGQKGKITDLDHELLRLLATHAGLALFASALSTKLGGGGQDVVSVLRGLGE